MMPDSVKRYELLLAAGMMDREQILNDVLKQDDVTAFAWYRGTEFFDNPVVMAARANAVRVLHDLIDRQRYSPNGTTGASPLAWAAQRGATEAVKFLLEHRADPRGNTMERKRPHISPAWIYVDRTPDMETPFNAAILEAILNAGAPTVGLLPAAVMANNVAAVEFLLQRGVNPNSRDAGGGTALHAAAAYVPVRDLPRMVEVLVRAGAVLSLRDEEGFSAQDMFRLRLEDFMDEVPPAMQRVVELLGGRRGLVAV